jgi:hypothetical protein
MPDRPLVAFDIETIPDPDVGRRIFGFDGDDASVVREMFESRLEKTDGRTGYPQLPHQRVVTIGVAWLELESGKFKIGTVGGGAMEERSHLEGFFALFRDAATAPRLISWNGSGFDLPVIRYRSMLLGIAAPDFYRTDGELKRNNYQNRYHDMHVDLMDVLSGYGASHRVGLGTLSELVGLPGKSFVEGEVWEHILAGEEELVREYCKMDVLLTLLLYLNWEVHRGNLETQRLREYVGGIRESLGQESFAGWREIVAKLEGWPPWGG